VTQALPVLKLSANGNTFVLIDLRRVLQKIPNTRLPSLARKLSHEFASDGLAVLRANSANKTSKSPSIRMDFFNPDGSAAFCGNGTRAAGFYETHIVRKKNTGAVEVQTLDGPRLVEVAGPRARLMQVPAPAIGDAVAVAINGRKTTAKAWRVDAGCPHAVLFVDNAQAQEVENTGRRIRRLDAFQPAGTNVDFVQALSPTRLKVRTYERGVERETGSCGSGVLASAAVARHLGKITGTSCEVETLGGTLRVYFGKDAKSGLVLEGTVKILFQGIFYV